MTFDAGTTLQVCDGQSMQNNLSHLPGLIRSRTLGATVVVLAALAWPRHGIAQSVFVDATPSHVVNTFSPLYALGSTVDRVPSNATDTFFRPDQIKQVLSAGWGVISYRKKVFHRRRDPNSGDDSPLVRLFAPSPRLHSERWNGV